MASPARNEHGHFIKRTQGESQSDGIVPAVDDGSAAPETNGETITVVNPADAARRNDTGSEPGKRKAGRPVGSGKKEKPEKEKLAVDHGAAPGKIDLDSLNFTLFYAHSLLAKATKTPELELDKEEARSISTACMNVMQHYNIKASQKAIDWCNLLLTLTIVYGGKFHAVSERQNKERAQRKAGVERDVAPFMGNV